MLIVEDAEVLRKHLVRFFVREGFEVAQAATRAQATAALSAKLFSVVILDVQLPDGDGLDLLDELEACRRPKLMIVMTAVGTPENEARAARLGVRRLLRKPADLRELLAAVRE